jgi:hypothetical protein
MAYQTQTSRRDIKLDVTVLQYAHVIYLVATWLSSPRAGDAGRATGIRPAESHVRRAFRPFVWILVEPQRGSRPQRHGRYSVPRQRHQLNRPHLQPAKATNLKPARAEVPRPALPSQAWNRRNESSCVIAGHTFNSCATSVHPLCTGQLLGSVFISARLFFWPIISVLNSSLPWLLLTPKLVRSVRLIGVPRAFVLPDQRSFLPPRFTQTTKFTFGLVAPRRDRTYETLIQPPNRNTVATTNRVNANHTRQTAEDCHSGQPLSRYVHPHFSSPITQPNGGHTH